MQNKNDKNMIHYINNITVGYIVQKRHTTKRYIMTPIYRVWMVANWTIMTVRIGVFQETQPFGNN